MRPGRGQVGRGTRPRLTPGRQVEGGLSADDAKRVVRCSGTGEDGTGGFFVALFALCDAEERGDTPPQSKEVAGPTPAKAGRNARKRQRRKERVQAAKRARAAPE